MAFSRKLARLLQFTIGTAVLACLAGSQATSQPSNQFAANACARRAVVDAASGTQINGIEDLVYAPATQRVYLSAYDREALAEAVNNRADNLPGGAIYALDISTLLAGSQGPIDVRDMTPQRLDGALMHPHGIAAGPDGQVAAVDRGYSRIEGAWRMKVRILTFAPDGDRLQPTGLVRHAALCRSNDLAYMGPSTLLVTADHGACGQLGRLFEDVLGLANGELVRIDNPTVDPKVRVVVDGLAYPNGVAVAHKHDRVYVAETRGRRIAVFNRTELSRAHKMPVVTRVELSGGPDNLNMDHEGRVLAATHVSLWRFALARYGWFGISHAPSRILAYTPKTGSTINLLAPRDMEQIAAATSAVVVPGALIVSSVIDDALLICRY